MMQETAKFEVPAGCLEVQRTLGAMSALGEGRLCCRMSGGGEAAWWSVGLRRNFTWFWLEHLPVAHSSEKRWLFRWEPPSSRPGTALQCSCATEPLRRVGLERAGGTDFYRPQASSVNPSQSHKDLVRQGPGNPSFRQGFSSVQASFLSGSLGWVCV